MKFTNKKLFITLAALLFALPSHAAFVSKDIPNDLYKSRAVVTGDVNSDGNIDIYVGNSQEQNKLWLGNGDGTFTNSDIPGDLGNTTDAIMADFNGDGDLDIYVLNWYEKNKLWLGNGDGTFADGSIPSEPDLANSTYGAVAVGDLDNDNDLDIFLAGFGGLTPNRIWINDGAGNFTVGATLAGGTTGYYDAVITDINSDGNLDIYQTTRQYNRTNKLWLGNGNGTFTNSDIPNDFCTDASGGCPGGSVSVGDIDGDGDKDIYLTAYYENSILNLNRFWINNGNGTFTSRTISGDYGKTAQDSQMVDIDGDNDLDILIAMYYGHQNILWKNDGAGNFIQDNITGDLGQSYAITAADFNNDGKLDVYVANGDNGDFQNKLWLQDVLPPVITVLGNNPVNVEVNNSYTDAGATCTDNIDSSCVPVASGTVDTSAVGTYIITYTATDEAGNSSQLTRTVNVVDTTDPVITLNGSSPMQMYINSTFTDPGASCSDNYDTTCSITALGSVVVSTPGTYPITYQATDANGNTAQITRNVEVITGGIPIVSLVGANPQTIQVFGAYAELGASAIDLEDGALTNQVVIDASAINTNIVGTYSVTYRVTDSNGNLASTQTRSVNVVDVIKPSIELNGSTEMTVYLNDTFTDPNASCTDNYDVTCAVLVSGTVNTAERGIYTLYYNATDSSGNQANQLVRTVEVKKKPSLVSRGGGGGGSKKTPEAQEFVAATTEVPKVTQAETLGKGETCSADLLLTQNLKAGARNGIYHSYTKAIVKEVKILQNHMNRLGFNSGLEDGILGSITDGAIKRMQKYLGTRTDGLVGPVTRSLINKSC